MRSWPVLLLLTPWAAVAQIEGAIDLHVHSAPDSIPRALTAIETAQLARRHGMRAVLFKNHSLNDLTMPPAIQREVVSLGALLEFPIGMAAPIGTIPFDEFAARIRAVGPENVVLSTDLGQAANPVPPVGFATGVTRLLEAGFTQSELDFMIRRNPARILKLDP